MSQFVRANLVAAVIGVLFLGYAAIGTLAAPEVTPWADPFQTGPAAVAGEVLADLPDAVPDVSPAVPPDVPPNAGGLDGDDEHDAGVPPESPACVIHGCREVETEDGTKNLPSPAADAIEGDPGQGPPDEVPVGPPDGVGPDDDGEPHGPPDWAPGPPDGVPGHDQSHAGLPDWVPGPPPWAPGDPDDDDTSP